MKFKRHILMTSAVATLAVGLSVGAHAQDAATAAAPADDSQTVVVTGIRKSLQSALKQKRNSDRVSEIITAEDIGKFPDKNVADSLSRATGVNVVTGTAAAGGFGENEHISIRGTDPNLNLTLLDGHNMATGDWFVLDQTSGSRSFNYTMLPSEVVGTIEVIKASSADVVEGGIGGTVDVHVRKPLDLPANTFAASAQGMYSTLADKWNPNVSGMYSWKNESRTFGVLFGAFYEKRAFRRDGQEILGFTATPNFAGTGQTKYIPSLIGSAYFTQERIREGGNFMAQWRPSDKLEIDFSGLYTNLKADNENHNFMMWGAQLSAVTPDAYTVSGDYVTSASWAAAPGLNAIVQDDIFRKAHSNTYDLNVDFTYKATDSLTITGQAGYTHGEGVTDDTAAWETYWDNTAVSYQLGDPVTTVHYGLPSDPTSAAYLNNKYSWSWGGTISAPDEESYAKLDAQYDFADGVLRTLKFGVRATDHTRELNYLAYAWPGNSAGTANLASVFTGGVTPSNYAHDLGPIPGYSYASADAVYTYLDSHNGGRTFAFYAPQSFAVSEKTSAAYVMAKLGGERWKADVGVRAVETKEESTQYSANASVITVDNIFGKWGAVVTENDYTDILPSANFTYQISDNLLLRAGAAKVMTRPSYSQLAGYFYLVDATYTGGAGGNPNLDPYRAWQYNLAAEYYYGADSLVSFGVFDLDIGNYITQEQFTQFYKTQQTPQGHDFLMTGPANGGKATSKGYEFSWQQPFADTGAGFIFNYTYADSKGKDGQAVDGSSKHTYNATVYYENTKFSGRLAYNFRSKFKSGIDRGSAMWQDDYGTLDGSFSYNLSEHVALTLDAQNIAHEKLYYFVGDPSIPRAYYDNGQSWYLGVRLKY